MNSINRAASCLVLAVALTSAVGCSNNFALIGRPTLQLEQEEIFAEIDRVDTASRLLHVRPEDSGNRVVSYSADARVLYQGRESSIAQLERGDKVSMQLTQDARGNSYTSLIRVQERIQDRNQSRGGDAGQALRVQTLDGRVAQLDVQRRSFEIRDQSREPVLVSLPSNADRLDVDRLRALRDGDYVRVEGKFLDRQRFEMATFLRDNQ